MVFEYVNIVCYMRLFLFNCYLVYRYGYGGQILLRNWFYLIGLVGLTAVSGSLLYAHTLLRVSIIACLAAAAGVLGFRYRKQLLGFVKKVRKN